MTVFRFTELKMAVSNVAELTVDELKELIREVVTQTMLEFIGDPDAGLEVWEEFKAMLQQSLESVQAGGETTPAHEVAQRLGLEW